MRQFTFEMLHHAGSIPIAVAGATSAGVVKVNAYEVDGSVGVQIYLLSV